MNKRKKILLWFGVCVAALIVILLTALLFLPKLINLESIRKKALSVISEKIGGEARLQRIDLSIFPYPHVVIYQGSLTIPGKVQGAFDALHIYPEVMPLFKGRLQIAALQVEAPDFNIDLPAQPEKERDNQKPVSFEEIQDKVGALLAPLALDAPDLVIELEDGSLSLYREKKLLFSFSEIQGRLHFPPGKLNFNISCHSNLWESISASGLLDAKTFKGNSRIVVNRLQAHTLGNSLFPHSALRLTGSEMNLIFDMEVDGANRVLKSVVNGSIPQLTIERGKKETTIKGKNLKAAFQMNEAKIEVSLVELNLDYPSLALSGKFLMDPTSPEVSFELEGKEVDALATREVVLALAGDIKDVQEVFEYVRGGRVPGITIQAHGKKLDELDNLENMVIRGRMVDGRIFVPAADMDLEDVTGDVVISDGTLKGENLRARYGKSRGLEGKIEIGLKGDDAPFHLDILVQADLKELPQDLKHLVDNDILTKELSLIDSLEGSAKGRLILGESTTSIKTHVDISEFNLSAKYQRVPYPIHIKGGRLTYKDTGISVKDLSGILGKSSFSGFAGYLDWEKEPYFEIRKGKSKIDLEEIYQWLISFENFPIKPYDIKSVKGNILVSGTSLKGRLSNPETWQYRASGEIEKLLLDSPLIPWPLEVTKGKYNVQEGESHQNFSFQSARITILDATFNTSGILEDYRKGLTKAVASIQGNVGPEMNRSISSLIQLRPGLILRAPLSISQGHLIWEKEKRTSFQGDLAIQDGPDLSMNILVTPDEMNIKHLVFKDKESDASLTFHTSNKAIRFEFIGRLTAATTDRLFVDSNLPDGWLEGDFRAHILKDQLWRSTVQGKLEGGDLIFPYDLKIPLEIDKISLNAEKNHVNVGPAVLISGSRRMAFSGDVKFSPDGLAFDMDLDTDGFSWSEINSFLDKENEDGDEEQSKRLWDLPVGGSLRLKSKYFNYDQFTWFPFNADITLAQNEVTIAITEAKLCGISTPGILKITSGDLSFDFKPVARSQQLDFLVKCMTSGKHKVTGEFDLKGNLKGQGKPHELLNSLHGDFEIVTKKGRIYRHNLFTNIFAYLNVTEAFFGKFPGIRKEGIGFESIKAKAVIQEGKIELKEASMDGDTMDVACTGDIDLIKKQLDLEVLVAPMKTVDRVVRWTPILRHILAGHLVSIPIRITGDMMHPVVKTLPASSVGSGLLGIMKRTVTFPIKVVEPIIHKEEEAQKELNDRSKGASKGPERK